MPREVRRHTWSSLQSAKAINNFSNYLAVEFFWIRKCRPSRTVVSDLAMSTIALAGVAEELPLKRGAIATAISSTRYPARPATMTASKVSPR